MKMEPNVRLSIREAAPQPMTDVHDNMSRTMENNQKMDVLDNLPISKNKPAVKLMLDKNRMETPQDITMGLNSRNQMNVADK